MRGARAGARGSCVRSRVITVRERSPRAARGRQLALEHPRMRNLEPGLAHDEVAVEQDVMSIGRGPQRTAARAAHATEERLDPLESGRAARWARGMVPARPPLRSVAPCGGPHGIGLDGATRRRHLDAVDSSRSDTARSIDASRSPGSSRCQGARRRRRAAENSPDQDGRGSSRTLWLAPGRRSNRELRRG
jgi:hypothetical protein